LQLTAPRDPRVMGTVNYLVEHCLVHGGFFQDMTHSGINAYLTLHLAQVLLRAADQRYRDLVDSTAQLATSTGQWPEAIHPTTRGGCMGDGQHGWAAAEWIMMMRSLFLREEEDRLILLPGVFPEWLASEAPMEFGPTPTRFGPVTVGVDGPASHRRVHLKADWFYQPPLVEVSRVGRAPFTLTTDAATLPPTDGTESP
jgi:hypothetical protein